MQDLQAQFDELKNEFERYQRAVELDIVFLTDAIQILRHSLRDSEKEIERLKSIADLDEPVW
jgi:intracellular sulfur oxidation DsrE/DsrF family protein